MLAADMLSFVNEPTAVLHDLRASGMALPLLDEPHVMQLRTPVNAKLGSSGDLTLSASPTLSFASPRTSLASPRSSDAGSPEPEAPAKRVRLRQKTAAPLVNEECSVAQPVQSIVEDWVSRRVWNAMTDKVQYNYAYDKIRNFYCWRLHGESLPCEADRDIWNNKPNRVKQQEARATFKSLSSETRIEMARKWLEASSPPVWVRSFVEHRFLAGDKDWGTDKVRSLGLMLTWNLPVDAPSATSEIVQSLPPEQLSLDQLVLRLRDDPAVKALFSRVEDHGMKFKPFLGADDVAMSLEVCPETWSVHNTLRLHIHMFFKSNCSRLRFRQTPLLDFEGSSCIMSSNVSGNSASGRAKSSWSGFFYCCLMEKKGTVFTLATKAPFTKFLVSPSWIMNLVQGDKLDTRAARQLLVRCVSASRHVKELEQYEMELEKDAVKEAMVEAQMLLSRQLKKQKLYEKVQVFMSQFDEPQHRYKFLVLSGPSRVGKTAFARSLCEADKETLEINCASGMEPNLRAYRLRIHGLILFDEIVAAQVAQQRKLFQAQSAPVQLGCSATNCHSYEVFVWRTKLVLASNNWHSSLATLSPDDQEWINLNSIVLDVEEAMWEV